MLNDWATGEGVGVVETSAETSAVEDVVVAANVSAAMEMSATGEVATEGVPAAEAAAGDAPEGGGAGRGEEALGVAIGISM
jgi:hypothetical protein